MFLAIDIGNTHISCGIHEKKWIQILRIPSNLNFLNSLLELKKHDVSHVAISSVVPKLDSIFEESIRNLFHIDPFMINYKNSQKK